MQESIFDIFGTKVQQQQLTVRPSSVSYFGALKGADNVKPRSSSVSDLPSSKKALVDAGNKIKSLTDTQESRKALATKCNQENSFIKAPAKSPLGSKKPIESNLKLTVRTPLSDIKATSQKLKQPLQITQNSATVKNEGTDFLLSEIHRVENFVNGVEDFSWLQPDDLGGYEYIDDYEDIIANSLRPSDENIHKMVNFWETQPQSDDEKFEFCPLLPVLEELDNGIGHTFIPDIVDSEADEELNLVPDPPLD